MTSRRMFLKGVGIFAAALVSLAGCVGPGLEKASETAGEKPLRVAVFVDDGARNIGAFRWIEIATMAESVIATPVDGAAVRAGALDTADVLVMPGGGAATEARSLGEEGRERVKSFVRGGGGYIGTCAGFYLVTLPTKGVRKDYLGLIPFVDTTDGGNGRAELNFAFNEKAEQLAGIKKGIHKIQYSHGPVPVRSKKEVEGMRAEVLATYHCVYNPRNVPSPAKAGHPAVVAAECGKGKMFVFTCHPESDVDDHEYIQGAFRYVTGREVRWRYPQRKPGQLAVGFLCDNSFGVETASLVQRLLRERAFDIVPINEKAIGDGTLSHLDAILAPSDLGKVDSKTGIYGGNEGRTKAFIARGGRIVAWGNAAERAKKRGLEGVVCAADANAALANLRAFAAERVPVPAPFPKKVDAPVKLAVFAGSGCSMGNIPPLLEFSPEYAVDVLGAEEVTAGALTGYDALYMPGGYSSVAYQTLGEGGRKALVDYVRGGGKYYGVCGGAFLVSQTKMRPGKMGLRPGDTPFLGLMPFKEDFPHHYRGKAPVRIRLTETGKEVFPNSATNRVVWYSGGPAFVPAEAVEDSDIKVFAEYDSRMISTFNPNPTPLMVGKAAIMGGRVGKGKLYAQCPHPESHERNFDMVRDSFKWLAGTRPTGTLPARVRGAKSVFVKMGYMKGMNAAVRFVLKTLLHDRRFDCRIGSVMDHNALPHADAVVMCLFGKNSWTPPLRAFAANGGKVIFVAETEEKRALAATFEGATVVDSYDKVIGELQR